MKGIRKTLVASVLAYSTALHAQAEVNPFSGGIKAGVSLSPVYSSTDGAKFSQSGKPVKGIFFDMPWVTASLYGEYAFADYFGIGLEAGYMKQGGTLEEGADSTQTPTGTPAVTNSAISMASHGIYVPLSVYFYPMGREEVEEGIFKVYVGGSVFLPLSTVPKNGKDATADVSLTAEAKKELSGWDVAPHLGVTYEFPIGISLDLRGGLGLRNRFDTEKDEDDQTIFKEVSGLKIMKAAYVNLNIGYNITSLFTDTNQA